MSIDKLRICLILFNDVQLVVFVCVCTFLLPHSISLYLLTVLFESRNSSDAFQLVAPHRQISAAMVYGSGGNLENSDAHLGGHICTSV